MRSPPAPDLLAHLRPPEYLGKSSRGCLLGTNYYLHVAGPAFAGTGPVHIGKSSVGWVFALHVYPDLGIRDLTDWQAFVAGCAGEIQDEYGRPVAAEEMWTIITARGTPGASPVRPDPRLPGRNTVLPGPNGLRRSPVDGEYVIAHGAGTWDCYVGDFS